MHRQSVIHSMVEFTDGATIAMASPPDMRIPIALAMGWPHRVADAAPPVDWSVAHTWTFEPLDETAFPAVALARAAGRAGGTAPAAYNAANEECVESFLAGRIPFTGIVDTVAQVVSDHDGAGAAGSTVEEILAADQLGASPGARADQPRELTEHRRVTGTVIRRTPRRESRPAEGWRTGRTAARQGGEPAG